MVLSWLINIFPWKKKQLSLYDKLGGESAIDAVVSILYRKIIEDDELNGFFDGICVHYQQYKQKVFLSMVLGGPIQFSGKDLRKAHQRLVEDQGLSDAHFDGVLGHLRAALEEVDVSDDDIDQVIAVAEGTRNDVLSR